jgi:hypothetical protein
LELGHGADERLGLTLDDLVEVDEMGVEVRYVDVAVDSDVACGAGREDSKENGSTPYKGFVVVVDMLRKGCENGGEKLGLATDPLEKRLGGETRHFGLDIESGKGLQGNFMKGG